ncbi:MAG: putative toxin-antitoxin system toxin component, PIN family [Spirochaetales bacterium]|nr:putative toxin-antitoxin system toxin component, PIN family [Spirochaetales bacterium]
MLVVLDTNVIFQGLDSDKGASYKILELLGERRVNLALSYPVICEYEDVLKRAPNLDRLCMTSKDIDDFLAFIAYTAYPFDPSFLMRPNLRDEADNIFVELAFVSNADYLITGNVRDFTVRNELKIDSFQLVTPRDFIISWRNKNEN